MHRILIEFFSIIYIIRMLLIQSGDNISNLLNHVNWSILYISTDIIRLNLSYDYNDTYIYIKL